MNRRLSLATSFGLATWLGVAAAATTASSFDALFPRTAQATDAATPAVVTEDSVKAQTKAVTDAVTNLAAIIGTPDAPKATNSADATALTTIAGLKIKDDLSDVKDQLDSYAKAPIDENVLTRLRQIQDNRLALTAHLAELKIAKASDKYGSLVATTRSDAETAISKAEAELAIAPYADYLGDTASPGKAVTALTGLFQTAIKASDVKIFGTLATDPSDDALLDALKTGLPAFVRAQDTYKLRKDAIDPLNGDASSIKSLKKLLPKTTGDKTAADDLGDKLKALTARRDEIGKKLSGWFDKITTKTQEESLTIVKKTNDVRLHKTGAQAFAYVERQTEKTLSIVTQGLVTNYKSDQRPMLKTFVAADDLKTLDQSVQKLGDANDDLAANATQLDSLIAQTDQDRVTLEVRLSYFPDVARLVRVLNPGAQLIDPTNGLAATESAAKHADLRTKESNLAELRAKVADIKTRLRQIGFEIARARTDATEKATTLSKATGQQEGLVDAGARLLDAQNQATQAGDAAAVTALQTQINALKTKADLQQRVVDAAKKDSDAATTSLTALLDEQTGLPAAQATAQTQLTDLNGQVETLRATTALAAQGEADAFATARDNAPYWTANPIPDDPDPVRRVYLFADPDGRSIVMRGGRDDVAAAREVIAEFDKPAPQTKLTFYTLQMTGDDDDFKKDNAAAAGDMASDPSAPKNAMGVVDAQLDEVRIATTAIEGALRDAFQKVVNQTGKATLGQQGQSGSQVARYNFYAKSVSQALGFVTGASDVSAVTRYTMPTPLRLTTLGELLFNLALASDDARADVSAAFLTNLQKIKTAYSLTESASGESFGGGGTNSGNNAETGAKGKTRSKPAARHSRLLDFTKAAIETMTRLAPADDDSNAKTALQTAQEAVENDAAVSASAKSAIKDKLAALVNTLETKNSSGNVLQSLIRLFGVGPSTILPGETARSRNQPPTAQYTSLTPQQREILDALLSKARTDLAGTVYSLTRQLDQMPEELRYSSNQARNLREQYLPLVGWLAYDASGKNIDGNLGNWNQDTQPRATSWADVGADALDCENHQLPRGSDDQTAQKLAHCDRLAFEMARAQYVANPLSKATARIAAADKMIRDMIDLYNDDVERVVRRPALQEIRNQIKSNLKGVSFGDIEETSFVATNRRVARVDPSGSGSLSVDEQADFSQAATALSNLAAAQGEREKVSNGVTGSALTALAAAGLSNGSKALVATTGLTALLGTLLAPTQSTRETGASEVYSVSTGNLYKVTPIFDPSGQGLRFQFDFAGTTRVREPNGTTNPALPRIERHTVNTEVALSNLDMRPISSFDTDYQLGMPLQRSGGLPILNQFPGLKELPLIGYYTERKAQKAQRQKSIIVAQSVIYPTVGDIIGLMLDNAALPVTFSPEPPSSSREVSETTAFKPIIVKPTDIKAGMPFSITVKLNRPVKKISLLKMRILGDAIVSTESDQHELRPGQDIAVFSLKATKPATVDISNLSIPTAMPAVKEAYIPKTTQDKIKSDATAQLKEINRLSEKIPMVDLTPKVGIVDKNRKENVNLLVDHVNRYNDVKWRGNFGNQQIQFELTDTDGRSENMESQIAVDNTYFVIALNDIKAIAKEEVSAGTPAEFDLKKPERIVFNTGKTYALISTLHKYKMDATVSFDGSNLQPLAGSSTDLLENEPASLRVKATIPDNQDDADGIGTLTYQAGLNPLVIRFPYHIDQPAFAASDAALDWTLLAEDGSKVAAKGDGKSITLYKGGSYTISFRLATGRPSAKVSLFAIRVADQTTALGSAGTSLGNFQVDLSQFSKTRDLTLTIPSDMAEGQKRLEFLFGNPGDTSDKQKTLQILVSVKPKPTTPTN